MTRLPESGKTAPYGLNGRGSSPNGAFPVGYQSKPPFPCGAIRAVRGRITTITIVALVSWVGVAAGVPDKVSLAAMLVLGIAGLAGSYRLATRLEREQRETNEAFGRLATMRAGERLPDAWSTSKVPLVETLLRLERSPGPVTSAARASHAEMMRSQWVREVGKINAYATMLVALGVAYTMMSFCLVFAGMGSLFDAGTVEPSALFSLLPSMATATVTSLLGGLFGGVLLSWIATRLMYEVGHYASVLRAILDSYDFGDQ